MHKYINIIDKCKKKRISYVMCEARKYLFEKKRSVWKTLLYQVVAILEASAENSLKLTKANIIIRNNGKHSQVA